MIEIESLGCDQFPALSQLNARITPGEVSAICGDVAEERGALVELLAGYRNETEGKFIAGGKSLSPSERRAQVAILPHRPALTADLNVQDHIRLVARLRGLSVASAAPEKILAFARVDKPRRRPEELAPDSQLRLTLALALIGSPALAIALDPPPQHAPLLNELVAPDRSLVLVLKSLAGFEASPSRVWGLHDGTLDAGLAQAPGHSNERVLLIHVEHGGAALEALLSTWVGVRLEALRNSSYRIHASPQVALAPLIRTLLRMGIELRLLLVS